MELAIISDIHANRPALDAVLSEIETVDPDGLLCAGDLVGYYTWPNEVIEELQEREVVAVAGNHDAAVGTPPTQFNSVARQALEWTREELTDANKDYLEGLPTTRREEMGGEDLYMVHGSPRQPLREYVNGHSIGEAFVATCFEDPPDICIMGHTHHQYSRMVDDVLFCNPGSVGQPRDGDPRAGYAILDTGSRDVELERVEYDIDTTAEAVRKHLPDTLGERLYHGI